MPPRPSPFGLGPRLPKNWTYDPLSNTYGLKGAHPEYTTVVRGKRRRTAPKIDIAGTGRELARYQSSGYGRAFLGRHRGKLIAQASPASSLRGRSATDAPTTGRPARPRHRYDFGSMLRSPTRAYGPIQIPYRGPKTFGAPPKRMTPLGQKILQYTLSQKPIQARRAHVKRSLGLCYEVAMDRLLKGYKSAHGMDLMSGLTAAQKKYLDVLSGSRHEFRETWSKIPRRLQYTGVPGAGEALGLGKVVGRKEIWNGELMPGAPLQLWDNSRKGGTGHSAILERYVRDKNGKVIGLIYSDQWFDYKVLRRPDEGDVLAPNIFGLKFQQRKKSFFPRSMQRRKFFRPRRARPAR